MSGTVIYDFLLARDQIALYHGGGDTELVWHRLDADLVDVHTLGTVEISDRSLLLVRGEFAVNDAGSRLLRVLDDEYWRVHDHVEHEEDTEGAHPDAEIEEETEEVDIGGDHEENDLTAITLLTPGSISTTRASGLVDRITFDKSWRIQRYVTFYSRCKKHAYPTYFQVDWDNHVANFFVAEFRNGRGRGSSGNPLCWRKYRYKFGFHVTYYKNERRLSRGTYVWVGNAGYKSRAYHKKKRGLRFAADVDNIRVSMAVRAVSSDVCPWD